MPPLLNDIVVCRATADDLPRIENLMQFYNYDLSEWYPVEFAAHGLYAIRPKQAYWAKPDVVPYKVLVAGHWAGFAVVDDEVVDPASHHNLGYFFVARRYRGLGVGRRLAETILREHAGRWEIYHLEANQAARRFWPRVIERIAGMAPAERGCVIDDVPSTLYTFSVDPPRAPRA
jgi:predicted acetyltransferase